MVSFWALLCEFLLQIEIYRFLDVIQLNQNTIHTLQFRPMSNHKKGNHSKRPSAKNNENIRLSEDMASFLTGGKYQLCSTANYSTSNHPSSDNEVVQLRYALCEAVEENEFLRERVIELEALVAEAQGRMEEMEGKFINDMNLLQRLRDDRKARGEMYDAERRKSL